MPSKEIKHKFNRMPKCFKKDSNIKLISITREDTATRGSYTNLGTTRTPKTTTKPFQNNPESEKTTYRRDMLANNTDSNV